MSHKISRRVLQLQSRILRNSLAIISLAGFMAACSGNSKKDDAPKDDSLSLAKEKQRQDSLAIVRADSIEEATYDSIARVKEDSLLKAHGKPVAKPDAPVMTKYGVPQDMPTKYGVPKPDMN